MSVVRYPSGFTPIALLICDPTVVKPYYELENKCQWCIFTTNREGKMRVNTLNVSLQILSARSAVTKGSPKAGCCVPEWMRMGLRRESIDLTQLVDGVLYHQKKGIPLILCLVYSSRSGVASVDAWCYSLLPCVI